MQPLCLSFCGPIVQKNERPLPKVRESMYPSQNEQKRDEQTFDKERPNILAEEIDSWGNFEYALREKNRPLFNKMLSECKENEDYIKAVISKDEFFLAESLFVVSILQPQTTINELIAKASEPPKKKAS